MHPQIVALTALSETAIIDVTPWTMLAAALHDDKLETSRPASKSAPRR